MAVFSGRDTRGGSAGRCSKRGRRNRLLRGLQQLEARQLLAADAYTFESASSVETGDPVDFTLQLLHVADQEGRIEAIEDAPRFSAVLNALRNEDLDVDGTPGFENTLTLSSGDAFIPGVFFDASESVFGAPGIADIRIQNELGIQAISLGNHEFDRGTDLLGDLIGGIDFGGTDFDPFEGTNFPYLSSNLDFSADPSLADLVVTDAQPPVASSLAASTVIDVGGDLIGIVGATTPTLPSISSPGDDVIAFPDEFDGAPTPAQLDALAAEIQLDVDAMLAAHPDMNKVVLLAHMQQISIEQELAERLSDVDIIVAGGSNTRLFDGNDRPRVGDSNQGPYPIFTTDVDGNPVAVVNTDGNYKYVGRLVIGFDEFGQLLPFTYDENISGAYATDDQGVSDLEAESLVDPEIQDIVNQLENFIIAEQSDFSGITSVFLNGDRGSVRTEETNLGNLTADANLAVAQAFDPTVQVSIKNGGGIRANIGRIETPAGGTEPEFLPPAANPLTGAPEGAITSVDIQNTLAFNNGLSLLTLTADELFQVIEHGLADTAPGATPGRFPQVSGLAFSFDATAPAGSRVHSLAVVDNHENVVDVIAENGTVSGDPDREIRLVTLNFLADGGNGYPFDVFGEDRVEMETLGVDGEQAALAEYLAAKFDIAPFSHPDTPPELDRRIQNLQYRDDTVLGSSDMSIQPIGTYQTGIFDDSAAEIAAYDPDTQRVFFTNSASGNVDILDISDPTNPSPVGNIDLSSFGGGPNSVDVYDGIVAVAIESDPSTDPGVVAFFDSDGNFLNSTIVGAQPDMLTFSPDGTKILVAGEGEPLDNEDPVTDPILNPDPLGTISIIDLSSDPFSSDTVDSFSVNTLDFTSFDGSEDFFRDIGVRIFPGRSASQDLEPEYIAVSPDGTEAFVTLQEANAFAVVDLVAEEITQLVPLGTIDHSIEGYGIDASDRDDEINIQNWPVFGMFMPDAITSYEMDGQTYYITANEGDSRDFDESRLEDLTLDPSAFPDADVLQQDETLGRLAVSTIDGDTDGDGDYDQLFSFGTRSFSIWDGSGNLIYDSGDDFEQITAGLLPEHFNSNNDDNDSFDSRSDAKGPEPEAVTTGVIDGNTYAFVGLERVGGIMVYDVSDPVEPEFISYVNNRDFSVDADTAAAGDLGVEDLKFVPGEDSPTGVPLLIAANEVSGTVTVFEIGDGTDNPMKPVVESDGEQLTIRRNGDNVQVVNETTDEVLLDQPLSETLAVTIAGSSAPDRLTVDFDFGGDFYLPGGVKFDAGPGRGNQLSLQGSDSEDRFDIGRYVVGANSLQIHIPEFAYVDVLARSGDGDDTLGVTSTDLFGIGGSAPISRENVLTGEGDNDTYVLNALRAQTYLNDNGGDHDAIDLSGFRSRIRIDVSERRMGRRQSLGNGNRLTLGEGTLIEKITGTAFGDYITGNEADNIIRGLGGNDRIRARGGNDIVLGGEGNDRVYGDDGLDFLIGGLGFDRVIGLNDDDLLIGGSTTFDRRDEALKSILDEWTSGAPLDERADNLVNGGGLNGSFALVPGITVIDDEERDVLYGLNGDDLAFIFDLDRTVLTEGNVGS